MHVALTSKTCSVEVAVDILATNWLPQLIVFAKVAVAGVLGAAIGYERELADKPAGLRTHALLAAAAALLVGLTGALVANLGGPGLADQLRVDPLRVVGAIVTGVAFLGAGTIFRHHDVDIVEGLTTAASLLLVAAIAIATAAGQVLLAVLVTVLSLGILRLRRYVRK